VSTFQSHFRRHDPTLHEVVRKVGPFTLKPDRDRFGMLVRSIISQQISTSAARSIRERLHLAVAPHRLTHQTLAQLSDQQIRAAGVSPQKLAYLRDLTEKVGQGTVKLNQLGRLRNERIVEELTQIKGIGRWTAQMFLIFALGREDVFPVDDFGVRSAMRRMYQLDESVGREAYLTIATRWSPYASIASWYCWRYLEL
jgi:DNA-3-methyladenine glycosylase II